MVIYVNVFLDTMPLKPIHRMMHSDNKYLNHFGNYVAYLIQYRNMFTMLVEKDIKGRFQNTILGYFWHLLNPLTQIIIYYAIFTVIFGRDIPNYWVYISTGVFAYSFFSNSCMSGYNAILSNANLIKKMTFPREILIFAKIASGVVTLSISYVILTVLMFVFGVPITINILYVPIIIVFLTILNVGIAMMIGSMTVYVRDLSNIIPILINCMMFAIPLFYTVDRIYANPILNSMSVINPLYYFTICIHDTFYAGISPNLSYMIISFSFSILIFIAGLFIFKKLEKGFAERL